MRDAAGAAAMVSSMMASLGTQDAPARPPAAIRFCIALLGLRSGDERGGSAAGDLVPVGRPPQGDVERLALTPPDHGRSRDARPRLLEERVRRPEALSRERAVHLHPGRGAQV